MQRRTLTVRDVILVVMGAMSSACASHGGQDGGQDAAAPDASGGLDSAANPDGQGRDAASDIVEPNDGLVVPSDAGMTVTEDGGTRVCFQIACAGHVLQCGDCVDDDGDGVVDDHDPECLGPCDNTEGPVLLTGVGGEAGGPCKSDCYFDFGNGSGGQDCVWDHRCDPLSVAPNFPPEGPACPYTAATVGTRDCPVNQPAQCLSKCMPLTPNGCDCFGCCTFPQLAGAGPGGSDGYVWLGSRDSAGAGSCTLNPADLSNPNKCKPCTPVQNCFNPCGRCEVCLGRPAPPSDCFMSNPGDGGATNPDGGTTNPDGSAPGDGGMTSTQCSNGLQPCGLPGQASCPQSQFCITGCCQFVPG